MSDNVFKFLLTKGKVEAGSSIDLSVTFSPILTGEHYQTFHLRSHNQVIVLELSGHLKSAASTANRNSLPLKAKKSTKSDRPRALPKVMFKRTASDTQLSLRQVHICNSQSERMDIQLEVTKPWQIPTQRVTIDAGSFLELPVAFCPSQSGYYQGVLRVTSSDGRSSELCLEGEMHP